MRQQHNRAALAPGHAVHWYQVRRVLGQGGFGITYLAHDLNLDQPVAIKEHFPGELVTRDSDGTVHAVSAERAPAYTRGLQRFIDEGRVLARFDHPAVVRVLSVFEANGTAYMVMRYETGETLLDLLRREDVLAPGMLRRMFMPVLHGLDAVHAAGFIHRDIKPANLFVRDGGGLVLLDFGSARQAADGDERTLTRLVSPGYSAFEQYQGRSARQGPWTDIYALGCVLYRATVGRPPVEALERSQGVVEGRDPYVPATVAGEGYAPALLGAIDHALAFAPEQRPQTVAAWARELGFSGVPDAAPAGMVAQPPDTLPSVVAEVPADETHRVTCIVPDADGDAAAKAARAGMLFDARPVPARAIAPPPRRATPPLVRRWPLAAAAGVLLAVALGVHAHHRPVAGPSLPAQAARGSGTAAGRVSSRVHAPVVEALGTPVAEPSGASTATDPAPAVHSDGIQTPSSNDVPAPAAPPAPVPNAAPGGQPAARPSGAGDTRWRARLLEAANRAQRAPGATDLARRPRFAAGLRLRNRAGVAGSGG